MSSFIEPRRKAVAGFFLLIIYYCYSCQLQIRKVDELNHISFSHSLTLNGLFFCTCWKKDTLVNLSIKMRQLYTGIESTDRWYRLRLYKVIFKLTPCLFSPFSLLPSPCLFSPFSPCVQTKKNRIYFKNNNNLGLLYCFWCRWLGADPQLC